MKYFSLIFKGSIARKLSIAFILLSLIATVVITVIETYWDYKTELQQINIQLESIKETHAASIAASVWNVSHRQIKTQLQGLHNTPDFSYIEITTPYDDFWSEGKKLTTDILVKKISLEYSDMGNNWLVGTMLIQVNMKEVFKKTSARALQNFLYFAVWIFILAGCQFLIFRYLVTRHLNHLARYTSSMKFIEENKDLVLNRNMYAKNYPDELDSVVYSINSLRKLVINYTEQIIRDEHRFRGLFENTDISIWNEDLSQVYLALNELKSKGIIDIHAYLTKNKNIAYELAKKVTVIQMNEATLDLFQAKSHEHLLINISETFGDGAINVFIEQLCCIWHKKKTFRAEANFLGLKGKKITAIVSYQIPGREEDYKSVSVSMFDISKRKESEQKLLSNSEIITNMTEGAYLIKVSDGIIIYTNPAFESMFGYEHDEMLGQHVSIVNAPTDINSIETVEKISSQINKTGSWHGEVYNIKKDGTPFWCSASVTTFIHPQHGAVWVAVHTDITEKIQSERLLQRTQKMDAVGKLTGGIAHDYNNMLGIIIGYSELLEQHLKKQPKLFKYAEQINHAAERGAHMTKKLLSFSKAYIGGSVPVNINLLLQEQQDMIQKTLTPLINIEFNFTDDIWLIDVSINDLEDAIINLSINAMHAIQGHGKLTFMTCNTNIDNTKAELLNLSPGDYVALTVEDNGCGMDEATIDRVFEPFYSTKGELGTGLGLSQVYGFTERSHGLITLDSALGKGSTFTLYFPRILSVNNKASYTENMSVAYQGTETILIVDDEVDLLKLNCEILEEQGYLVKCATNGQQAMDILKNTSVNLVVSDVVMPNMNGFELMIQIKEKYPTVKLQLVSGYNDNINIENIDKQLLTTLIMKPFTIDTLLKRVRSLLDN
jgi:PAS domain S-box-containing protein